MTAAEKVELRPPALLAVGIIGHGNGGTESREPVAAAVDALLREFHGTFIKIVAADRAVFSDAPPTLRLVGMAVEGMGLLGAQAARALGTEIACISPFAPAACASDHASPAAPDAAETIPAGAQSLFILPGQRSEGARAYERANNVILANIDVLVAVWDGARADVRAGTGDVVQAAVSSGIPVLVIDPTWPARPRLLLRPGEDQLESPIATDLRQASPEGDFTSLLQKILVPPSGSEKRQGLDDLYVEEPGRRPARFEYPLLLEAFGAARVRVTTAATGPDAAPEPSPEETTDNRANELDGRLGDLERRVQSIDEFGVLYGRLFRSSNASAFLLIILAALLSAMLSILYPDIFGVWLVGQMVVNGLVLIDARVSTDRRWHERWLDYRLIAERLRCLRFLHPLGLGLGRATGPDRSWVDWYIRRTERGLGAPTGRITSAVIARAARELADVEIGEQVNYHRRAFRQLRILERRLSAVSRLTLRATIVVAAGFGVFAYFCAKESVGPWQPLAMVLVFALPAATSAFRGLRAEADLVRLAERSAGAAVALARLRRAIGAAAPTYDRIAVGAMRAAAIMGAELSDWRFVLERRRARARGPLLGQSRRRTR